ncbi:helix-turn-helix domain-containing protein [Nocardia sp. CDC160]|uniref:helix-turn-helix domain-containing protein n=1 Tax=Nocardia sp. CDC160 TaxID=3112166 RepID=UPI002DB56416|nr:helix-turn-helix domain-containing protein [Nocardia sp. CDC160]MEC3918350.1 helix-turn-helix domain-containing protein [Nocardia sp. CDC160]
MAKMGRRKRSRLITQGLITSGKTKPQVAEAKSAEAKVAAAEQATGAKAAVKAEAVAKPKAAAKANANAAAKASAAAKPSATPGAPDLQALADRVKARRKENGWTQADVAKQGGPSAGAISQIERCLMESPAEDVLAKLDAGLEWPAGTAGAILAGTAGELVGSAR